KDYQWHYVKTSRAKTSTNRFRKYALAVRRIIDSSLGTVSATEIDVKSQKLAQILEEILEGVGNLNFHLTPPQLSPEQLFIAREGLETRLKAEKAAEPPDETLIDDIDAALELIEQEYGSKIADLSSLLEHEEITFRLLWALFTPGVDVFSDDNLLRQPLVSKCYATKYGEDDNTEYFEIESKILHHNGESFGWGWTTFKVPRFEGSRKIHSLDAFPFEFHPQHEDVRAVVLERGKKYVNLLEKPVCKQYQGFAVIQEEKLVSKVRNRISSDGRIMVDPAAFLSQRPGDDLLLGPRVRQEVTDIDSLGEGSLMYCHYHILGFAFTTKRWASFAVSKITDVIWKEDAFDKVLLSEKKREMIKLLVQSHQADDDAFDDIIKGKGKGLVGLLTGSPGVGKTLTAEAVAETCRKPLYAISSGELGTSPENVDDRLVMVLDMARRWNCVLLLDEADIFLYKRGEAHVERNALVSIFLRRLEYFLGIVILTTNRRQDIDDAFKSRIHFKFHYPPLDAEGRFMIWKNMLSIIPAQETSHLRDDEIRDLASRPINGREIKNTVSCAASIVRWSQKQLTITLIKDVLELLIDDDPELN
ncbi:AAA family ATPase, partial [Colletotrichum truncatum]